MALVHTDECSNDEDDTDQDTSDYLKKNSSDGIPGLDLSDPKQLAEFARYLSIYDVKL